MTIEQQHKFGGPWTVIKLEILQSYLKAYTTALSQTFDLTYIDAFAGKGDWVPAAEADEQEALMEPRKGSAQIALENNPPFQPPERFRVFDGGAEPGIRQRLAVQYAGDLAHPSWPLGQNLVGMLRGLPHHFPDLADEIGRHAVVEQVAHRIDEDVAR